MNQQERRIFLIRKMLSEQPRYADIEIPENEQEQKRLLRSLFNIRMPGHTNSEFLSVQDAYLQAEMIEKGVTDISALTPMAKGIYL